MASTIEYDHIHSGTRVDEHGRPVIPCPRCGSREYSTHPGDKFCSYCACWFTDDGVFIGFGEWKERPQ